MNSEHIVELTFINDAVREDPVGFIARCDDTYTSRINKAADIALSRMKLSRIILLAGPSASGKTTTASRVRKALEQRGVYCHMVSLDDYYRMKNEPDFPRTANGELDLEAPEALRIDLLNEHLSALDRGEEILVPHYDFQKQCISEEGRPLQLKENECVIFEGIHGLNPILTERHPEATRLFVSPATYVFHEDEEIFDRVWMRVVRRTVRDYYFRCASASDTLGMWANVRRGEKHYITPYKRTAHFHIDSAHNYEIPALKPIIEPLLLEVKDNPQQLLTDEILHGLQFFEPMDINLLPPTCLLKEEFLL